MTKPQNELERSSKRVNKLEIAVPRPLSSTYDYILTESRKKNCFLLLLQERYTAADLGGVRDSEQFIGSTSTQFIHMKSMTYAFIRNLLMRRTLRLSSFT